MGRDGSRGISSERKNQSNSYSRKSGTYTVIEAYKCMCDRLRKEWSILSCNQPNKNYFTCRIDQVKHTCHSPKASSQNPYAIKLVQVSDHLDLPSTTEIDSDSQAKTTLPSISMLHVRSYITKRNIKNLHQLIIIDDWNNSSNLSFNKQKYSTLTATI